MTIEFEIEKIKGSIEILDNRIALDKANLNKAEKMLKESINLIDERIDKLLDVLVEKKILTSKERQKVYDKKEDLQKYSCEHGIVGFCATCVEEQKEISLLTMQEEPTDEDLKNMEIDRITDNLYSAYSSGYGVLFGIPSELKSSVRAIVKLVLEQRDRGVK